MGCGCNKKTKDTKSFFNKVLSAANIIKKPVYVIKRLDK